MTERTIWLKSGEEVKYCPYCHNKSVWPTEVQGLWGCESCHRHFLVKHRKPEPKPRPKAMKPEELHALLNRL